MSYALLKDIHYKITHNLQTPEETGTTIENWLSAKENDLNVDGWRMEEMILEQFNDFYEMLLDLILSLKKEEYSKHNTIIRDIALKHIPNLNQLSIVETEALDLLNEFEVLNV